MNNVLIATDGSEQSLEAARYLRTLVGTDSIRHITVIAVIRPLAAVPFVSDFGEGHPPGEYEPVSFRREAQEAVERVAAEVGDLAPEINTLVWSGSPAEEIVRAAREVEAGLIVVSSRGSGVVDSVLMGSVAHRVLHYAHCPVLVVRPT